MIETIQNSEFRIKNPQSGFTLIEILLFMGIFSILIIVLFTLLTSIFDVQLESESSAYVSEDGRYILNRFSYDITRANSISLPALGNSGSILEFVSNGTTYTYSLSNGNLVFTNNTLGTSDNLNSFNTSVTDVSFLKLSDTNSKYNTVTFSFTLTSKTLKRSGEVQKTFRITAGER